MARYFRYYPNVKHSGKFLVDITKRSKFITSILSDPRIFLPFTVNEGERAEDIAHLYYEDVNLVWLIYLANTILDPYKQWPMTQRNFNKYIVEKYRAQSGATTDQGVLNWTQNTIKHYYLIEDEETTITKDTYDKSIGLDSLDTSFISSQWQAVSYYDYEDGINESNRHIQMIDRTYAKDIERELKRIMNE
jgi:hypothetical protein